MYTKVQKKKKEKISHRTWCFPLRPICRSCHRFILTSLFPYHFFLIQKDIASPNERRKKNKLPNSNRRTFFFFIIFILLFNVHVFNWVESYNLDFDSFDARKMIWKTFFSSLSLSLFFHVAITTITQSI